MEKVYMQAHANKILVTDFLTKPFKEIKIDRSQMGTADTSRNGAF